MVELMLVDLTRHTDPRGTLFEVLRAEQTQPAFGQIYFSTTNPGHRRGGHYHTRKREYFCVVQGEMRIHLIDVNSREEQDVVLQGSQPRLMEVPPYIHHTLINEGTDTALLLIYVTEPFDPTDADTYPTLP